MYNEDDEKRDDDVQDDVKISASRPLPKPANKSRHNKPRRLTLGPNPTSENLYFSADNKQQPIKQIGYVAGISYSKQVWNLQTAGVIQEGASGAVVLLVVILSYAPACVLGF